MKITYTIMTGIPYHGKNTNEYKFYFAGNKLPIFWNDGQGLICRKMDISSEICTSANQKSYRSELQTGLRCIFFQNFNNK